MKNDFHIEVKSTIHVSKEDIDDIMYSALEGGICYWCCKAEVIGDYLGEYASEQISLGGSILIYDNEEAFYKLTIDKLLNGIREAYDNEYFLNYGWCNGKELDCCNIDGEVADVIIQYALFGDVIYG